MVTLRREMVLSTSETPETQKLNCPYIPMILGVQAPKLFCVTTWALFKQLWAGLGNLLGRAKAQEKNNFNLQRKG